MLRVQRLKPTKKILTEFWREWRQALDHAVALDDVENAGVALLGVAEEWAEFDERGAGAEVHA